MARIGDHLFQQWTDGTTIKAEEYTKEREVIRAAINHTHNEMLEEHGRISVVLGETRSQLNVVTEQGNYAKEQGDYAKEQAELLNGSNVISSRPPTAFADQYPKGYSLFYMVNTDENFVAWRDVFNELTGGTSVNRRVIVTTERGGENNGAIQHVSFFSSASATAGNIIAMFSRASFSLTANWGEWERVDNKGVTSEHINLSLETLSPSKSSGAFERGYSYAYLSGSDNTTIFRQWMESIGKSLTDYGFSDWTPYRLYIETHVGGETGGALLSTGMQTVTLFQWSSGNHYQIHGKFQRMSNSSNPEGAWGRWHEIVLEFERGTNNNGTYIRYTNGVQECWLTERQQKTNIASSALYRSETMSFPYPADFHSNKEVTVNAHTLGLIRWATAMNNPSGASVGIRQWSTSSSDTDISVRVYARGWWR